MQLRRTSCFTHGSTRDTLTIVAVVLAVTGYVSRTAADASTVVQPASAVSGIVLIFSVVPAVLMLLSLATLARYRLRRGDIDGVEQLTRYLELLGRDPHLAPVQGVFAAQEIKPQARTLAADRGIRCVRLDYEALKGIDDAESRLF